MRADVPESLTKIFNKATKKGLKARYQTALDMASDLSSAFTLPDSTASHIEEQEKFNLIKKIEFFRHFPEMELWEIINAGTWQNYATNENIIIEGEIDDCFYIIVTGNVGVVKNDQSFRALGAGDCFGEMGYLAKTERTATIAALAETNLLKLNSTVMPQLSINCQVRFLKEFVKTLIQRLTLTTTEALQHQTAPP